MAKNTSKLVARGYITIGVILELTPFFYVSKGTYDTRMVFDATVIGINDSLWAPNFIFSSMGSFLMMVGLETHRVNIDVGEMFYKFLLSSMLANYCGVDLGSYLGQKKDRQGKPLWMCWVRLMMGLVLSPYSTIQVLLWVSEVMRGDRSDPNNPFRWDKIRFNLSGDPIYSPTIPWISKFRGRTQELATDFTTYVYDSIVAAGSEKVAWSSARIVGSIWKYLGLHDAPRKRRIDGQDVGPWRGRKVHIIHGSIYHLTGEGKRAKTWLIIKNVLTGSHWENTCNTRSCKVIGDY